MKEEDDEKGRREGKNEKEEEEKRFNSKEKSNLSLSFGQQPSAVSHSYKATTKKSSAQ